MISPSPLPVGSAFEARSRLSRCCRDRPARAWGGGTKNLLNDLLFLVSPRLEISRPRASTAAHTEDFIFLRWPSGGMLFLHAEVDVLAKPVDDAVRLRKGGASFEARGGIQDRHLLEQHGYVVVYDHEGGRHAQLFRAVQDEEPEQGTVLMQVWHVVTRFSRGWRWF